MLRSTKVSDEKQRRMEVLTYLENVFREERPTRSVGVFLAKLRTVQTDELYRIADAIQRFGLDNLL